MYYYRIGLPYRSLYTNHQFIQHYIDDIKLAEMKNKRQGFFFSINWCPIFFYALNFVLFCCEHYYPHFRIRIESIANKWKSNWIAHIAVKKKLNILSYKSVIQCDGHTFPHLKCGNNYFFVKSANFLAFNLND